MAMEIERRFLVQGDAWRTLGVPCEYHQGYLSVEPERVVRVRVVGEQAWLTLKAKVTDVSRYEFEYAIPKEDALTILGTMCPMQVIKQRTRVEFAGQIWEIDEFSGVNSGLVLAEIELTSEEEAFEIPDWIGQEITQDGRFSNAYLAHHPYTSWIENH
jgi:adenylate cyclase